MSTPPSQTPADLSSRYLTALVAADAGGAEAVVGEGIASGLGPEALLVDCLGAAQARLGQLWQRGELSIAQEHLATEVTRGQVERVRLAFPPQRPLGVSAVVSTAPGEAHTLPARIVAALFAWRGWQVDLLGEAPPGDELAGFIEQRRPQLVALSVTLVAHLEGVRATCRRLSASAARPRILVGGAGTAGQDPPALGADAVAEDARSGLARAAELTGLATRRDLGVYLAAVGRRIREARRAAGLSQAELAERSDLARPYLGAVERGRQNFTLEAAMKIATALDVAMTDLLADDRE